MLNFSFTFPSNVIFGAGVFQSLGEEVTKFGKTALLVEQPGPLEPVFARGVALMEAAGVKVTELSGVESNPRLSKVEEGIKIVTRAEDRSCRSYRRRKYNRYCQGNLSRSC